MIDDVNKLSLSAECDVCNTADDIPIESTTRLRINHTVRANRRRCRRRRRRTQSLSRTEVILSARRFRVAFEIADFKYVDRGQRRPK